MATAGSLLTVSRASLGAYVNAAGVWSVAANNVLRRSDLGAYISEARTNEIRNPRCVGAVAGTPGTDPTHWNPAYAGDGLARQIVGTGTEDGINYIDYRFYGTASATGAAYIYFETVGTPAAATGQSWVSSVFVKLVGGSVGTLLAAYLLLQGRTAGNAVTDQASVNYTPTVASLGSQRVSIALALVQPSTASLVFVSAFSYASGAVIDFTIRVGWPCLERGAFALAPPLPAVGATGVSTRAADAITLASYFSSLLEGTVFAEFVLTGVSGAQTVISLSDGTGGNRIKIDMASGAMLGTVVHAGTTVSNVFSGAACTAGVVYRVAMAWRAGELAMIRSNGGTLGTAAPANIPPTTQAHIGSYFGGASFLNGTLRDLRIYPTRFPNDQLAAMVA